MNIKVYIDGSCIDHGTASAIAGYGVAIRGAMHVDLLNKLPIEDKQDSSRAEAKAFLEAVRWLRQYPGVKATIYSDSEMIVKFAHGLLEKETGGEEKNFWKLTKDLLTEARHEIMQLAPGQLINIKWVERDQNNEANSLARRAANALLLVSNQDLPQFAV